MPQICIHKKRSRKSVKKAHRKRLVRFVQRYQIMADTFAQLSPIDESRIRHRANREAKQQKFEFSPARLFSGEPTARLTLAYKYTLELLATVIV